MKGAKRYSKQHSLRQATLRDTGWEHEPGSEQILLAPLRAFPAEPITPTVLPHHVPTPALAATSRHILGALGKHVNPGAKPKKPKTVTAFCLYAEERRHLTSTRHRVTGAALEAKLAHM